MGGGGVMEGRSKLVASEYYEEGRGGSARLYDLDTSSYEYNDWSDYSSLSSFVT